MEVIIILILQIKTLKQLLKIIKLENGRAKIQNQVIEVPVQKTTVHLVNMVPSFLWPMKESQAFLEVC